MNKTTQKPENHSPSRTLARWLALLVLFALLFKGGAASAGSKPSAGGKSAAATAAELNTDPNDPANFDIYGWRDELEQVNKAMLAPNGCGSAGDTLSYEALSEVGDRRTATVDLSSSGCRANLFNYVCENSKSGANRVGGRNASSRFAMDKLRYEAAIKKLPASEQARAQTYFSAFAAQFDVRPMDPKKPAYKRFSAFFDDDADPLLQEINAKLDDKDGSISAAVNEQLREKYQGTSDSPAWRRKYCKACKPR